MKLISVKYYEVRSGILAFILFCATLIAQDFYLFGVSYDADFWWFIPSIAFLIDVICILACLFEIRTVTKNNERFLGYKAYILFFMKVFFLVFAFGSAILLTIIRKQVPIEFQTLRIIKILFMLISDALIGIYLALFLIYTQPYEGKEDVYDVLTIHYHAKVKDRKKEGSIKIPTLNDLPHKNE